MKHEMPKLPSHPEPDTMTWTGVELLAIAAYAEQVAEPLLARIAKLETEELRLHKELAESVLRANAGWARYENANGLSLSLQALLASGQEPAKAAPENATKELARALASLHTEAIVHGAAKSGIKENPNGQRIK